MIQTTPIHLNKPATYDGKRLYAFRPWWARINAYLHAYAASFPTDSPEPFAPPTNAPHTLRKPLDATCDKGSVLGLEQ